MKIFVVEISSEYISAQTIGEMLIMCNIPCESVAELPAVAPLPEGIFLSGRCGNA